MLKVITSTKLISIALSVDNTLPLLTSRLSGSSKYVGQFMNDLLYSFCSSFMPGMPGICGAS